MWMRMISSKLCSALKPSAGARVGAKLRGQPSTIFMITGSGSRRMRLATSSPATLRSAAICSPTVTETPGMVRFRRVPTAAPSMLGRVDEEVDRRARAGVPVADVLRDRQHRLVPGERLADDAGEEAGGRLVRLAGPDADGGQADADAVHEAAPRVVGEEQLVDRLLRPVGGERRVMELVRDRVGERRAEHRDRRGEDDARAVAVADLADRLEQVARAVEVDAVALLEVGLRLARDDRGEVEDDVGPVGDERSAAPGRRQVDRLGRDRERRAARAWPARRRRPASPCRSPCRRAPCP